MWSQLLPEQSGARAAGRCGFVEMAAGVAAAVVSAGDVPDRDSLASSHRTGEPSASSSGSDDEWCFPAVTRGGSGWVPPSGPTHTHYASSTTRLGGGAFGEVLLGTRLTDGVSVALKRIPIRVPDKGIPDNLLRELKTMQRLAGRSKHVLDLLDHYTKGNALVLVLELCLYGDLRELLDTDDIDDAKGLSTACVKSVVGQILQAVCACHALHVMHRDVKPGNVLVSRDGTLKLADFGLARVAMSGVISSECETNTGDVTRLYDGRSSESKETEKEKENTLTGAVQTRWYRAPEVLFGAKAYSIKIDVWSVGAILGELLSGAGPILRGDSDVDQLARTLGMLGTPSATNWPDAENTPDFHKIKFAPKKPMTIAQALPRADPGLGTSLWKRLFQLDPEKRPSAEQALLDPYFTSGPARATPWDAFRELRARRGTKNTQKTPSGDGNESQSNSRGFSRGTNTEVLDMPPGVLALSHAELRDALQALGLDGEISASL